MSWYPMISSHITNKEVSKKKIWYPMKYMVTAASHQWYYTWQTIYISIWALIYDCSALHIICVDHIQLWGHINLNISKSPLLRYIKHCRRITPYIKFYKQQIDYYNWTAYNLLQNKIGLILPNINSRKKKILNHIFRHCSNQSNRLSIWRYFKLPTSQET